MSWTTVRRLKILDWDIENRPLTYWCDRPSAEVTAIAWSFVGEPDLQSALLGDITAEEMLFRFSCAYSESDMVTGHYIRKHDLPIVNGALMELGMPTLGKKLVCDTRLDLIKLKDLPVSQEALGQMLGIPSPKVHMTQPDWREANRLTDKGIQKTFERVVGDVRQHKEIRIECLKRKWLKPPRVWNP